MRLKKLETAEELKAVWELDLEVFDEQDYQYSFEALYDWWKVNQPVQILAFDEATDKLMGYISFWPLTKRLYEKLEYQSMTDLELSDLMMAQMRTREDQSYFSLQGFVFQGNLFLTRSFLSQAMLVAFDHLAYEAPIHIHISTWSPQGQNLAEKLPFQKLEATLGGYPCYNWTTSLKDMVALLGVDFERLQLGE